MKFSKTDYNKLDRMECTLREMSVHYGYPELKEVSVAFMRMMREASLDEEFKPTWDEEKPFSHA